MENPTNPCPHCGRALPRGASFCPYCAQSIRCGRKTPTLPVRLWRRRLKWALPLAALALAVLGVWFQIGGHGTQSIYLEEDEYGVCVVTTELVQEYLPQVKFINFDGIDYIVDDVDNYLINSFQMAMLVSSHGADGSLGEWGSFDARNDTPGTCCLLLYDGNFHLMGYFVGTPEPAGQDRWKLEVRLCDYDFTALYEAQLAAFAQAQAQTFTTFIPPEEIGSCGAEWFLSGYNTGRNNYLTENDPQAYHLWVQLNGSSLERQCRAISQLPNRLPSEGRWKCFLLLDKDYRLLGYTMLDYQGTGLAVPDGGTL